jgi:hypothetical protein
LNGARADFPLLRVRLGRGQDAGRPSRRRRRRAAAAQTGTRAAHASKYDDRYVTVLASVRGTGNDRAYVPKAPPGANTLHFGGDTPSRLMLPVVPMEYVSGYRPVQGQCPYQSMRCLPG